jgi:large subunit ribosomal protein L29
MKTKEIRSFSTEEMQTKLVELKDKLFKQKFQKTLGQAENPYKIRQTKRDIAKLTTILKEKGSEDGEIRKKSKS